MKKEYEVSYSPELDIMCVDDTDKEYERSVRTGDFVIDLDDKDAVRGVEIQNISRILGIDREQLKEVSDAELETVSDGEKIQITVRLTIRDRRTTLATQLEHDLSAA